MALDGRLCLSIKPPNFYSELTVWREHPENVKLNEIARSVEAMAKENRPYFNFAAYDQETDDEDETDDEHGGDDAGGESVAERTKAIDRSRRGPGWKSMATFGAVQLAAAKVSEEECLEDSSEAKPPSFP